DPISQVSPYSAIRQVGKFEGDLPFEVSVAGEFNDSLFFKEFSLFPLSASTALDSLTKSMWAGMQIGAWEEGTPTNDLIQKIMSLSLESRVLSEYTAFLALEPSDTTAPCLADECIDETALPVHIDQLLATELEIKIGPNPFKEQLIVRGKLIPGSVTPTIRVFDLMGRVVSLLLIETEGEEWRATWDGSSSAGHSLPTGVYLLKVEVNGQSVLRRIIKQ
ncbi:MAG: T9SS type A sorting domain-containing protein, partial [Bacteroidota bacterium]